jgi:nitrite reductase (NADH) small subunit/3-phenylpropionate/trans-cinnamate dioxygenase ferredoxin subunit
VANWVFVTKTAEVPENGGKAFPVLDRMIAIFHDQGAYYALDDFCPHQGASLAAGWIHEGCVACPWHAWRFALKDGTWMDNPKIRTEHYSLELRGDDIFVDIPSDPVPANSDPAPTDNVT